MQRVLRRYQQLYRGRLTAASNAWITRDSRRISGFLDVHSRMARPRMSGHDASYRSYTSKKNCPKKFWPPIRRPATKISGDIRRGRATHVWDRALPLCKFSHRYLSPGKKCIFCLIGDSVGGYGPMPYICRKLSSSIELVLSMQRCDLSSSRYSLF